MNPLQFLVPLAPLQAAEGVLPTVILVFVLANMVTRYLAHRKHVEQAAAGDDEAVTRSALHTVTTVLLILITFAYAIVEPHTGVVMGVLILAMFLADFFEFESRRVEVRNEMELESPKSALAASFVVLLYAVFLSLFVYIAPIWNAVI
ncbi:MAG: hypothetical protein ABEJ28_10955 [Salinigranum sp.]